MYQATKNSSETTQNAAASVAEALGARHLVFDVDHIVGDYEAMVAHGIGRDLSWETDDLALQNIQARARAPGVWMLANLAGALLLATSNRSEAAVGYATMDGDTCGGLSPIAGIDKAFLRQWLRWMETDGPDGLSPLPALAAVNAQQPTAELRPLEQSQTDEGDLMPYDLLDAIERAAIRDKHPAGGVRVMRARFPSTRRSNWACGSSDSSASGAAISGSGNGTLLRFIWMTKTWILRPGAGSRFSQAGFNANSPNFASLWRVRAPGMLASEPAARFCEAHLCRRC